MTATYDSIATSTFTSAGSVEFSSISQNYTDLVLIISASCNGTDGGTMYFRVGNGSLDTGSNYSFTNLAGTTSAVSSRGTSQTNGLALGWSGGMKASEISNVILQFQNYSNTTTNKTMLSRANSTGIVVETSVSLWRSTSAINILNFYMTGGRNLTGTATLYGIKAE
jgi:hypothetical protein